MIHQTQCSASTKKEAEVKAAKEILPYIRAMLEDGGELVPVRFIDILLHAKSNVNILPVNFFKTLSSLVFRY